MDLKALRTKFIDLSGRFDLVVDTTDYVDAGANFFIQAGQRFLDRAPYEGKDQYVRWKSTVTAGTTFVKNTAIRAVKSVRVETVSDSYFMIKKKYGQLREEYGDIDGFPNTTAGAPRFYAPVSVRSADTPTIASETERGIFILPPPDISYEIEIEALFSSADLTDDTDVSFWTVAFPETLIQAAWYELERYYRNTAGMKDHLDSIRRDLQGIDFDEVEEEMAGLDSMQDSWRFE